MFMLPNAGIHFSFRKISEEHKQGNGPTITEVRFQTKQLYLFLEVYFFYDELDDLNPTHFLDSVRWYYYSFLRELPLILLTGL